MAIKRSALASFYCAAQSLVVRLHPAREEALLLAKRPLLFSDEVTHRVAERGDVVFRFARLLATPEPERRHVRAQCRERRVVGVAQGISACIECYRRLSGAD